MADVLRELAIKLVETIKIEGLGNLAQEYTELGLDLFTGEGLLRDIPLVGTIVNISKAVGSIRDILYLRKLLSFLHKVGEATQEQREKFVLENCKDIRQFGDAILLILEQADNMNKSSLIGKIFKACIQDKISYQDALTLSSIVNKALWQDLEDMFQSNFTDEMRMRLCNCGILNLGFRMKDYIDETKKPKEIKRTVNGFSCHENQYYEMLLEIAQS